MKVPATEKYNASLLERLTPTIFRGDPLHENSSFRATSIKAFYILQYDFSLDYYYYSFVPGTETSTMTSRRLCLWSLMAILLLISGPTNVQAQQEPQEQQQGQQLDELEVDPSQQRRELWDFFSFVSLSTCLCPFDVRCLWTLNLTILYPI
jgi:hypothetical protein